MPRNHRRQSQLGLRGRVVVSFALLAGLIALIIAVSVFTVSRSYMLGQRERSAERQASTYAQYVRNLLKSPGESADSVINAFETPVDTYLLLQRGDDWFRTEPSVGPAELPAALTAEMVDRDSTDPVALHMTLHGQPYLAIAISLGDGNETLYELAPLIELQNILDVLRIVLGVCAAAAACGGAVLGWWASRRVLDPLHQLGETTARIAGGALDSRLPATGDRELVSIVDSFNTMVDSLQQRIERERRFFGDVSHELRTPLTTLIASMGVLVRHSDELPDRSKRALSLITAEVDHLHRLLDDLLALARIDAGLHQDPLENFSLRDLLINTLAAAGRSGEILVVDSDVVISGRKKALERAFLNLINNADRHGHGLDRITLSVTGGGVSVSVDDRGPGVPPTDRERIFERFATGHQGRNSASGAGTGLGLALVAETVAAHGGRVHCVDNPPGGARFVVTLPVANVADERPPSTAAP